MQNITTTTQRTIYEVEQPEFIQKQENVILYDWFTGSSKEDSPEDIIKFLGLESLEFQERGGRHFYKKGLCYDGVNIYFDGKDGMGTCLDMTGNGCRVFETFGTGDWQAVFDKFCVEDNSHNTTRLDVAFDDFTGVIPLEKIAEMVRALLFIAKARKWDVTYSSDGLCVYIGSKKSDVRIRFYDKAAERGFDDDVHWVRCEIQLRDDRAKDFIKNDTSIGAKLGGVLNNYLRFIVENPDDSNKCRWETQPFWLNFVQTVEKISIFTKKNVEYNFDRTERYVLQQCGNSIETMIKCVGLKSFLSRLKERDSELNEKHMMIISDYFRQKQQQRLGTKKWYNEQIVKELERMTLKYSNVQ